MWANNGCQGEFLCDGRIVTCGKAMVRHDSMPTGSTVAASRDRARGEQRNIFPRLMPQLAARNRANVLGDVSFLR